MPESAEVITEVLGLLEPLVASDGGALRVASFAPESATLVVDYAKGENDACAACVIDAESLEAFIDEGLQARGLHLTAITVHESGG